MQPRPWFQALPSNFAYKLQGVSVHKLHGVLYPRIESTQVVSKTLKIKIKDAACNIGFLSSEPTH
jgi:hypothetical protein